MALNSSDFSSGGNAKFENEKRSASSKASFFNEVEADEAKSRTVVVPEVDCDSIGPCSARDCEFNSSTPGNGGRRRFSAIAGTGGTLSSPSVGLFDGTLNEFGFEATDDAVGWESKRLEDANDSKCNNSLPNVSPSNGSEAWELIAKVPESNPSEDGPNGSKDKEFEGDTLSAE